ncbi:MAG: hypothetical protein IKV49_01790, partial [Clostridia bacterium]|nr:hypothetical protein [Clostridia bacterium]
HHDGELPQTLSALSTDNENIVVTAIKSAEDSNGMIMRIIETDGKPTTATIDFTALGAKFTAEWKPQEIKTFRITADGVAECLITE